MVGARFHHSSFFGVSGEGNTGRLSSSWFSVVIHLQGLGLGDDSHLCLESERCCCHGTLIQQAAYMTCAETKYTQ